MIGWRWCIWKWVNSIRWRWIHRWSSTSNK